MRLPLAISPEACRTRSSRKVRNRDTIYADDFFAVCYFYEEGVVPSREI